MADKDAKPPSSDHIAEHLTPERFEQAFDPVALEIGRLASPIYS